MTRRIIVSCLLIISILLAATGCKYMGTDNTTVLSAFSSKTTVVEPVRSSFRTDTDAESETETETTTRVEAGDAAQSQSIHEAKETAFPISSSSSSRTQTLSSDEISETATADTSRTRMNISSLLDLSLTVFTTKEKTTEVHGNEFFNDAVFVGDSVTLGLKNYVTSERNAGRECLGKAQFLVAGSMGYINSRGAVGAKNSIHPTYKGKEVTIEDGIKQCNAKKVFIMLGMNDFAGYSGSTAINSAKKTFDKILEVNPDVKIYVESVTPITANKESGSFTNANVDKFNAQLKEICKEKGFTYVDVASCLKDSNNCLRSDYCSDPDAMGIHMNYKACRAIVDFLINKF